MSRVAIVFTGGTIAMQPDAAAGGNRPVLDGAAIIARAPGLHEIADLEPIDWGLVPASHLRFAQLLELAQLIEAQLARPEIDGAVLVQGTDTIEETAFAFDLLLRSNKPLIVTGAMRHALAPDYDGPRNLADAVRCAVSADLAGIGALVVLGGLILAADEAVKTHATAIDTFRSRDGQPIGEVHGEIVHVVHPRPPRRRLAVVPATSVEDVHLVTAVTGIDGTLVRLMRPLHPRGLVVAATGSGNTSAELLDAAAELIGDGTVVCLTTRCPTGTVSPAYAFPGGGATWQRAGALMSTLDGPRSRVALALGLAAGMDRAALGELLAGAGRR